jgi:hypothetical protein
MNPANGRWDRRVSAPALVFAFLTVVLASPTNAAANINGQVLGAGCSDLELDSNALGCERRCAEAARANAYWCGWSLRD